jgi:hypothetical protein
MELHLREGDSESAEYDAPVSVDWGDWQSFPEGVGQQLHSVERAVARRYFDALMAARSQRREQLEALLTRNDVEVSTDDAGVQALNDWYRANVEAEPREQDRLNVRWYAVGVDVGLYLGEAITARAPTVQWRLFTHGRKNVSYQRPVLMGFGGVANVRYNVDPERLVAIHGHRVVARLHEPRDLFVQIVRSAVAKA